MPFVMYVPSVGTLKSSTPPPSTTTIALLVALGALLFCPAFSKNGADAFQFPPSAAPLQHNTKWLLDHEGRTARSLSQAIRRRAVSSARGGGPHSSSSSSDSLWRNTRNARPKGGNEYYKILGIPRSASQPEIKQAFRKLVKLYHPGK
jgi:hypothetical protein